MSGLTIGWEYLTGYAVATDPSRRDRPEWPPHPARLFMALAAAWFETRFQIDGDERTPTRRESEEEIEALRWLETLGDPELRLPPMEQVFERSAVTVYVPVNDRADAYSWPDKKEKATIFPYLGSVAMGRNRQDRTFPRVWVGDAQCHLHWSEADAATQHRAALDRVCRKVTRIGHSSSLVRMWVHEEMDSETSGGERWEPDDIGAELQVRRVSAGTLSMLEERFNESGRVAYARLSEQVDGLESERTRLKGKGAKDRKTAIDTEIEALREERDTINARAPLRPTIGLSSGYRRTQRAEINQKELHTIFDGDLLVLTCLEGPQLPLESTLQVTRALRNTVMSQSRVQPPPAWVSGHESNGQPLRTADGHMACLPLPFVGREHADGHLLGVALAFPRTVVHSERGRVLGTLLLDEKGRPRPVHLKLGRLGVWSVIKREWTDNRVALLPETWTARGSGASTWASVTPLVLDRYPKADRAHDRAAWMSEVRGIVVEACARVGLPTRADIDVDTTSWHRGSPRAIGKRRVPRGSGGTGRHTDATLGDGFPHFPAKGTSAPRPQVHIWVRFAKPVVGPVLLGAGRFVGYGLCKPWADDRR